MTTLFANNEIFVWTVHPEICEETCDLSTKRQNSEFSDDLHYVWDRLLLFIMFFMDSSLKIENAGPIKNQSTDTKNLKLDLYVKYGRLLICRKDCGLRE